MSQKVSTASKIFLMTCVGVLFIFSPLSWSLKSLDKVGISRPAWDESVLLLASTLCIVFVYIFVQKIILNKKSVTHCLFISALLFLTVVVTPHSAYSYPE